MLSVDVRAFFQVPNESNERVLHAGTVVSHDDGTFTMQMEEVGAPLEPGTSVLVYCEVDGRFMQQAARIEALNVGEDETMGPLVGFVTTGNPVSAESRECYRTSTVMTDLTATVGDESSCQLVDVSATGFAVIAAAPYGVGSQVDVTIRYEGKVYAGRASVQSIKDFGPDKVRYGLHCLECRAQTGELTRGLKQISMNVQREQLRRRKSA